MKFMVKIDKSKLGVKFLTSIFNRISANVYKIDSSCRARQKILLLRNKTGPILQAVFNEIDLEIDFVKKGKSGTI